MDLDLPTCDEVPLPPPRLDNDAYLEFIEFNMQTAIENGTAERLIELRSRPSEEVFVLK